MRRIVVLTSNIGTGSNLQALVDGSTTQFDGQIVGVISGKADAPAVWHAKQADIPVQIYDWTEYRNAGKPRARFEEDLAHTLQCYTPDLIVCVGWAFRFSHNFLKYFPWRVLNLHPGLFGDKPGERYRLRNGKLADPCAGLDGKNAIQVQMASGAGYAGSTVHVVTEDIDWGPVVTRGLVKIEDSDTVESLYARLKEEEHRILLKAMQELCLPMTTVS